MSEHGHHDHTLFRRVKGTTNEVASQVIHLFISALGLVAALAWNDAVQSAFQRYLPSGAGLRAKFLYAMLVSVIIVLITLNLARLAGSEKKK